MSCLPFAGVPLQCSHCSHPSNPRSTHRRCSACTRFSRATPNTIRCTVRSRRRPATLLAVVARVDALVAGQETSVAEYLASPGPGCVGVRGSAGCATASTGVRANGSLFRPSREIREMPSQTSGAKGTRTPALTRRNAGLPAVSVRLVPIQSCSLPAGLCSGLDGVKSSAKACNCGPAPRMDLSLAAPGDHTKAFFPLSITYRAGRSNMAAERSRPAPLDSARCPEE